MGARLLAPARLSFAHFYIFFICYWVLSLWFFMGKYSSLFRISIYYCVLIFSAHFWGGVLRCSWQNSQEQYKPKVMSLPEWESSLTEWESSLTEWESSLTEWESNLTEWVSSLTTTVPWSYKTNSVTGWVFTPVKIQILQDFGREMEGARFPWGGPIPQIFRYLYRSRVAIPDLRGLQAGF